MADRDEAAQETVAWTPPWGGRGREEATAPAGAGNKHPALWGMDLGKGDSTPGCVFALKWGADGALWVQLESCVVMYRAAGPPEAWTGDASAKGELLCSGPPARFHLRKESVRGVVDHDLAARAPWFEVCAQAAARTSWNPVSDEGGGKTALRRAFGRITDQSDEFGASHAILALALRPQRELPGAACAALVTNLGVVVLIAAVVDVASNTESLEQVPARFAADLPGLGVVRVSRTVPTSVSWSSCGSVLAVGGRTLGGLVTLWLVHDAEARSTLGPRCTALAVPLAAWSVHDTAAAAGLWTTSLCFLPSEQACAGAGSDVLRLVSGHSDGTVRVWRVAAPSELELQAAAESDPLDLDEQLVEQEKLLASDVDGKRRRRWLRHKQSERCRSKKAEQYGSPYSTKRARPQLLARRPLRTLYKIGEQQRPDASLLTTVPLNAPITALRCVGEQIAAAAGSCVLWWLNSNTAFEHPAVLHCDHAVAGFDWLSDTHMTTLDVFGHVASWRRPGLSSSSSNSNSSLSAASCFYGGVAHLSSDLPRIPHLPSFGLASSPSHALAMGVYADSVSAIEALGGRDPHKSRVFLTLRALPVQPSAGELGVRDMLACSAARGAPFCTHDIAWVVLRYPWAQRELAELLERAATELQASAEQREQWALTPLAAALAVVVGILRDQHLTKPLGGANAHERRLLESVLREKGVALVDLVKYSRHRNHVLDTLARARRLGAAACRDDSDRAVLRSLALAAQADPSPRCQEATAPEALAALGLGEMKIEIPPLHVSAPPPPPPVRRLGQVSAHLDAATLEPLNVGAMVCSSCKAFSCPTARPFMPHATWRSCVLCGALLLPACADPFAW
jgi:hypothetical protein